MISEALVFRLVNFGISYNVNWQLIDTNLIKGTLSMYIHSVRLWVNRYYVSIHCVQLLLHAYVAATGRNSTLF